MNKIVKQYELLYVIIAFALVSSQSFTYAADEDLCVSCEPGFMGIGSNCLQRDEMVNVRGKVEGELNGIPLEDSDMHAFIHTLPSDGRNYIVARYPKEISSQSTLTLLFAQPIHWLFAGSNSDTLNGFELTGGIFTRQSDSTFIDENGEIIGNLYINQNFTGLNKNDNELVMNTHIQGDLPRLGPDEQVIYPDFNQNYVYKANVENPATKKVVESHGSITYMLTTKYSPNQFKKFRIEHNERIHFSVCDKPELEKIREKSSMTQLMTKRLLASYTDRQVRFTSANYLRDLMKSEADPCDGNNCSPYAECVIDSESEEGYYCQCKPGFDGDGEECFDINECDEGATFCSPIAECRNLLGYYECLCEPPKVGDGRTCKWNTESETNDVCSRCDRNAQCVNNEYCQCNQGYNGDGFQCVIIEEEDIDDLIPEYESTVPSEKNNQHEDRCYSCHADAVCQPQRDSNGECCVCLDGYIGNGKYCLAESNSVIVNGKITGTLNQLRLSDLDLYAYVLTQSSDSRNFVVIRNIPPHLGGSFQALISIVNPIGWLFSGFNGFENHHRVPNGFSITGGLFTRLVTLNFYDEQLSHSHTVMIKQEYLGLDSVTNELSVRTIIDGNLPSIDLDSQVVFKDYSQNYIRQSKGFIVSQGEIGYEVTTPQNSQVFRSYKIQYNDEIQFTECPFLNEQTPSRVNSKRVFIQYTKGDGLVRFSSANYIYPVDMADDPCETNSCSIYAECVSDVYAPNNYTCLCKVGFEGDGYNCYDIDECSLGDNDCDLEAECYNLVGHYECNCLSPYVGNGKECTYEADCQQCDSNAQCISINNQKTCQCNAGYQGDGLICEPLSECLCGPNAECVYNHVNTKRECRCVSGFQGDGYLCQPLQCNQYSNCDENARCVFKSPKYECECNPGFVGDGYKCSTQACDILNDCGENAICVPDYFTRQYKCVCENGYIGNGYQCYKDEQSCDIMKNCHHNAECLYNERSNSHSCECKPGFSGDGHYCNPINSCRAESAYETCDVNADCVYDQRVRDFICKCKSGYEGNGLRSKCYLDQSVGLFLVYAQGASVHKLPFHQTLTSDSKKGSNANRIVHIPGQTAVGVSYDCHEQFIYWSDVSSNVINRIRYDGSNYSIVLQNVPSAEGLAVDWISRNIYFTDAEKRTIEVASLDGKYRKVLIDTDIKNPRGIAIDPRDGYLFWCDWFRKGPRIERSNMDGTQRKVLVNTDLGVPNAVYFDHKRQEICWADAQTKRIECCSKDGSNRHVIIQKDDIYPFDLTEVRSNIYWTDWSKKAIQNVDKDGVSGESIPLSIGGNGRVYGIVAVKDQCPKGTNACDRTNGNCNQLCLPRPDYSHQCACSDDSLNECVRTVY